MSVQLVFRYSYNSEDGDGLTKKLGIDVFLPAFAAAGFMDESVIHAYSLKILDTFRLIIYYFYNNINFYVQFTRN